MVRKVYYFNKCLCQIHFCWFSFLRIQRPLINRIDLSFGRLVLKLYIYFQVPRRNHVSFLSKLKNGLGAKIRSATCKACRFIEFKGPQPTQTRRHLEMQCDFFSFQSKFYPVIIFLKITYRSYILTAMASIAFKICP